MNFKTFVLGVLLAWVIGVGMMTNTIMDLVGPPSSVKTYSPGELIIANEGDKLFWDEETVTLTVFDQGGLFNFFDGTPLLVPAEGPSITKAGTYQITAQSLVIDDTEANANGKIKLKIEGASVERHYSPGDDRGTVIFFGIVVGAVGFIGMLALAGGWLKAVYTAVDGFDQLLESARHRRREQRVKRKNEYFHE